MSRQPLAGLCATNSGKGHPPGAVGVVPTSQAWEALSNQLFVRHSSKQMPVNTAFPGKNQHKHAQTGLCFHSDSVLYGFMELWLP